MLFVVEKRKLQTAISIVRDDRKKKTQGFSGPFMRLEANDGFLHLLGQEASAKIPATVYELGVLFLKITAFRRLLRSITGEQFITIQITADDLLLDKVRLPLHANEMLLYPVPKDAPLQHPSIRLEEKPIHPKKRESHDRQRLLWEEDQE